VKWERFINHHLDVVIMLNQTPPNVKKIPLLVRPRYQRYLGDLVGRGWFGKVYRIGKIANKILPLGEILVDNDVRFTYLNVPNLGSNISTDSADVEILNLDEEALRKSLLEDKIHNDISGHSNIPARYDYWLMAEKTLDISRVCQLYAVHSQQYIPGNTLYDLIETGISLYVVSKCVSDIAEALERIHLKGYTHGDTKPHNVIVSEESPDKKDRCAYIIDYGAGKTSGRYDKLVFTPVYATPEQVGGFITPEVDYMALGLLTYKALTGEDYFGEDYFETLRGVYRHCLWLNQSYSGSDAADIVSKARKGTKSRYNYDLPKRFLEALELALHPRWMVREMEPLKNEAAKLAKIIKPY